MHPSHQTRQTLGGGTYDRPNNFGIVTTTPPTPHHLLAARALRVGAVLLWTAAAIHFSALPLLQRTVASQIPPDAYAFVWPPLAFLDGILLLPLGLASFYCAGGVLRGERWALVLGLTIALVVLSLPVVLLSVMGFEYFSATSFLVATLVILAGGLAMTVPLLRLVRHSAD